MANNPESKKLISLYGSELVPRVKLLGEDIVKAGREAKEYQEKFRPDLGLPYKDKKMLEKDKVCALVIAEYLQTLSEIEVTGLDSGFYGMIYRVSPLEHEVWKDMSRVLKNPREASISEIWLTDAILRSKFKDLFNNVKEDNDVFHLASEAYWRAANYLENSDSRCKLGGIVNDVLHIPIKIP